MNLNQEKMNFEKKQTAYDLFSKHYYRNFKVDPGFVHFLKKYELSHKDHVCDNFTYLHINEQVIANFIVEDHPTAYGLYRPWLLEKRRKFTDRALLKFVIECDFLPKHDKIRYLLGTFAFQEGEFILYKRYQKKKRHFDVMRFEDFVNDVDRYYHWRRLFFWPDYLVGPEFIIALFLLPFYVIEWFYRLFIEIIKAVDQLFKITLLVRYFFAFLEFLNLIRKFITKILIKIIIFTITGLINLVIFLINSILKVIKSLIRFIYLNIICTFHLFITKPIIIFLEKKINKITIFYKKIFSFFLSLYYHFSAKKMIFPIVLQEKIMNYSKFNEKIQKNFLVVSMLQILTKISIKIVDLCELFFLLYIKSIFNIFYEIYIFTELNLLVAFLRHDVFQVIKKIFFVLVVVIGFLIWFLVSFLRFCYRSLVFFVSYSAFLFVLTVFIIVFIIYQSIFTIIKIFKCLYFFIIKVNYQGWRIYYRVDYRDETLNNESEERVNCRLLRERERHYWLRRWLVDVSFWYIWPWVVKFWTDSGCILMLFIRLIFGHIGMLMFHLFSWIEYFFYRFIFGFSLKSHKSLILFASYYIPILVYLNLLIAILVFLVWWLTFIIIVLGSYFEISFILKIAPIITEFFLDKIETIPCELRSTFASVFYGIYYTYIWAYLQEALEGFGYEVFFEPYHRIYKKWWWMHDLNALKVNYQLAVQKGNILLRDNWYVGHVRTKAVFPEFRWDTFHRRRNYDRFCKMKCIYWRNYRRKTKTRSIKSLFRRRLSENYRTKYIGNHYEIYATWTEYYRDRRKKGIFNNTDRDYRRRPKFGFYNNYSHPATDWNHHQALETNLLEGYKKAVDHWSIFDQSEDRKIIRNLKIQNMRLNPPQDTDRYYKEVLYFRLRSIYRQSKKHGEFATKQVGHLWWKRTIKYKRRFYYPEMKMKFFFKSMFLRIMYNYDHLSLHRARFYQRSYYNKPYKSLQKFNIVYTKRSMRIMKYILLKNRKKPWATTRKYMIYKGRTFRDRRVMVTNKCFRRFLIEFYYTLNSNYSFFNLWKSTDPKYLFRKYEYLRHKYPEGSLTNRKLFHVHHRSLIIPPKSVRELLVDVRYFGRLHSSSRQKSLSKKYKSIEYQDIKLNPRKCYITSKRGLRVTYLSRNGSVVHTKHFNQRLPGYLKKVEKDVKARKYYFKPYYDPYFQDFLPEIKEPPLRKRRSLKRYYRKRLLRRRSIFWYYYF